MFLPCRPCCGGDPCDSSKVAIKFSGLPNLIPAADFSGFPTVQMGNLQKYAGYYRGWRDIAFFNYYPIAIYASNEPSLGACQFVSVEAAGNNSSGTGWEVLVVSSTGGSSIKAWFGDASVRITIELSGEIQWDTDYTSSHPDVTTWTAVTCDGQAVTTSPTMPPPSVTLDISAVTVRLLSSAPAICYRPCNLQPGSIISNWNKYRDSLLLDGVVNDTVAPVPSALLAPACEAFANADCPYPDDYSPGVLEWPRVLFSGDQVDFTLSSCSWERWCGGAWAAWGETIPASVFTTYTLDWGYHFRTAPNYCNYDIGIGWGWGLPWTDLPGGAYFDGVDGLLMNQIGIHLGFPARVNNLNGAPTTYSTRKSQLVLGFRNKYNGRTIYGGVLSDQASYFCKNLMADSGVNSVGPDNLNGTKNVNACGTAPSSFSPTNYRPTFTWSISQA